MNCKKGDLAVVIFVDGTIVQPNVGRIVRVLHRNPDYHYLRRGLVPCWRIRSAGAPMMTSDGGMLMEGNMPDLALRPIRPLEKTKTVKRDEKLTEPA